MMDQGFNVMRCFVFDRRRGHRMIRFVGAGWHIIQALFDNPYALAHFFNTHQRPVVDITLVEDGHLEIELIIAAIRAVLSPVEVYARRTKSRTRDTPIECLLFGKDANINTTIL